jgi:hypothetical protein
VDHILTMHATATTATTAGRYRPVGMLPSSAVRYDGATDPAVATVATVAATNTARTTATGHRQ